MDAPRLENMLRELFSIQVNTIVKQQIVATTMPNVAHALIDLAIDYGVALNRLGAEAADPPRSASWSTFDDLRERAAVHARVLQGLPADRPSAQRASAPAGLNEATASKVVLLCRIRDTCDHLKGFFHGPDGKPRLDLSFNRQSAHSFTPEQLALDDQEHLVLRKAWELGTEEVVMQTVVYLDGDVLSRIRLDYAQPDRRAMLAAHQQSVDTSIAFWKGIVDVVRSVCGLAARRR